jgi:ferredoxin-NADP reductase
LDAARRKLPHRIFLFYSNRRPEDAAFLDELQALEKQDANYTFVGTMPEMENQSVPGKVNEVWSTKKCSPSI